MSMSARLKQQVLDKCTWMDIPVTGFAGVGRWDEPLFEPWIPEEFRPRAIWPEAMTVIVIGLPVALPILETAPSIWYHELYKTVNSLLDESAYRIALFLTREGFPSVAVPRDGYGSIAVLKEKPVAFFSHRHAALLAGLGTFGVNNVLLTTGYGPRVRFASIFTSAEIPSDPLITGQLCTRCMKCVARCPAQALEEGDYPASLTDKRSCTTWSEVLAKKLISPCGICIKVCPVGEDRKTFSRERPEIYEGENQESMSLHRAWNHVRRYGGL